MCMLANTSAGARKTFFSKNNILGVWQPLGALLKTSFQQYHFELRSVAAHRNKSLICVPMDSPGITVAKKIDKMGMRVRHFQTFVRVQI